MKRVPLVRRGLAFAAFVLLPVLSGLALARTPSRRAGLAAGWQSQDVIKSVRVNGSTRFSSDQILRASGLKIGGKLTDAALTQAQQRLADSGAFTAIGAESLPEPGGIVIQFTLTDMQPLVACDFSGITGVDPKQLLAALQQDLPLFDGRVPLANPTMLNAVQVRVQAILKKKGISGRVIAFAHRPDMVLHPNAAISRMVFRVIPEAPAR